MKRLVVLLGATSLLVALSACGSSGRTAAGCHAQRTCPSDSGSYAWQPFPGAPLLVCSARGPQASFPEFVDYRGRFYLCKLPAPTALHINGGVDVRGPETAAAGAVPLEPHQLRFEVFVGTHRPAVLTAYFGDGTRWQRSVRGRRHTFNLVHSYPRTRSSFFLVTLRDKGGYESVEGEGPFRGPAPGPRTRYCAYEAVGKGGVLSATPSLACTAAEKLFLSMSPRGKVHGYRCRSSGLPPSWSDAGVTTCTSGPRTFVFTTNS